MLLPPGLRETVLAWFGTEGQAWLERLPQTVARLIEKWRLRPGELLSGGSASLVLAVSRQDGAPAVLKLPCLDDENRREADALRFYAGAGAVRLYEHDADTGAMLLERVIPGTALADYPDEAGALATACRLLRRLSRPPRPDHCFPLVRELAARWAATIPAAHHRYGAPFPAWIVNQAAELAQKLSGFEGQEVVVNRDGHLGNILAAQREPWLLIDPKPLVGETAFNGGYLVLDRLGDSPTASEASELVQTIAAGLNVEPERVRDWAVVRALENAVWALEVQASPSDYVAAARALLA